MTSPFGKPITGYDTDEFINEVRAAYGDFTADQLSRVINRNDTLEAAAGIINHEGGDFERAFQALDTLEDEDE